MYYGLLLGAASMRKPVKIRRSFAILVLHRIRTGSLHSHPAFWVLDGTDAGSNPKSRLTHHCREHMGDRERDR